MIKNDAQWRLRAYLKYHTCDFDNCQMGRPIFRWTWWCLLLPSYPVYPLVVIRYFIHGSCRRCHASPAVKWQDSLHLAQSPYYFFCCTDRLRPAQTGSEVKHKWNEITPNTRCVPSVVSVLGHRLRRWPNTETTLGLGVVSGEMWRKTSGHGTCIWLVDLSRWVMRVMATNSIQIKLLLWKDGAIAAWLSGSVFSYRRLLSGRNGHLDQSEAYDIS